MDELNAVLLRSRLHIRSARILFDYNKIEHGLGTLYDAIEYGMKYYYIVHINEMMDKHFNEELFNSLVSSGLQTEFDFNYFQSLTEDILDTEDESKLNIDINRIWEQSMSFLEELEVIPYDIDLLPKINAKTIEILGIDYSDENDI